MSLSYCGGDCMRRKDLDEDVIRNLICEALLKLLQTKEYREISVGDIADQAHLHRATFYRHFRSKEDVVKCCLTGFLEAAPDGDGTEQNLLPEPGEADNRPENKDRIADSEMRFRNGREDFASFILPVFRAFSEHKQQMLVLSRAGLSGELLDILKEYFRFDGSLGPRQSREQTVMQYRDAFRIGGIYASLLLWLSHDLRETPEEMTRIAVSLNPLLVYTEIGGTVTSSMTVDLRKLINRKSG